MENANRNTDPDISEPKFLNGISTKSGTRTELELEAAYAILCERLSNHKACIGARACLLCKLKKITSHVISSEEEKSEVAEQTNNSTDNRGIHISQEGTTEPEFENRFSTRNKMTTPETSSRMTLKAGLKCLRIVNNIQKKEPNDPLSTQLGLQVLEAMKSHLIANYTSIPETQEKMSHSLKETSDENTNGFQLFGAGDVRLIKLLYLLHICSFLLLSFLFVYEVYN